VKNIFKLLLSILSDGRKEVDVNFHVTNWLNTLRMKEMFNFKKIKILVK